MKIIMWICIFIILTGNIMTHRYLDQRIDILQEWIEVLHGIDFEKITKAVREWQKTEQTERSERVMEQMLIDALRMAQNKNIQALLLETYIQEYGAISDENVEIIRQILTERGGE